MGRLVSYFQEVKVELTKVTWPKKDEVARLTLLVFAFSGIVAIYLGGLDFGFTKILESVVSR